MISKKKMNADILKRKFMNMMFSIYISLLICIVYLPFPIAQGEYIKYKDPRIYIIPWQSTIKIYKKYGLLLVAKNIGGNLILLAPMIFFLCYYLKKLRLNAIKVLIISLSISLFIECTQVALSISIPNYARTFDTMDLICNSIGGLIGYSLYKIYNKRILKSIKV